MKSNYRFPGKDLRFQVVHIIPEKIIFLRNIVVLQLMLDSLWYESDIEKLNWYQMEIKLLKLIFYKNE